MKVAPRRQRPSTAVVEFAIVGVGTLEAVLVVWVEGVAAKGRLPAAGWMWMERPLDPAMSAPALATGVAIFDGDHLELRCLDVDGTLVAHADAPTASRQWAGLVPRTGHVKAIVVESTEPSAASSHDGSDLRSRLRRSQIDGGVYAGRVILTNP